MKTSFSIIISLLLFLNSSAQAQSKEFSILFYNLENLFDTWNDPLTADDEFTAEGDRYWTHKRFKQKLLKCSKAIVAASEWKLPTLIALSELENRYVLECLKNETPLKSVPYRIIHKDSPDFRGIDIALLYNAEEFYPIKYDYFPLLTKSGEHRKTREILYVSGIIGGIDTLHVFVNHWPSRYGGLMKTRELRNNAARLLRQKTDEVFKRAPNAKIIIMGDFNDQPSDESLEVHLRTQKLAERINPEELYNLSEKWSKGGGGTLKYRSQWYVFDQFIVSGSILDTNKGLYTSQELARICKFPFLMEEDKVHGGKKLFRTYNGYKYNGGFSDHFPVQLKLRVN